MNSIGGFHIVSSPAMLVDKTNDLSLQHCCRVSRHWLQIILGSLFQCEQNQNNHESASQQKFYLFGSWNEESRLLKIHFL